MRTWVDVLRDGGTHVATATGVTTRHTLTANHARTATEPGRLRNLRRCRVTDQLTVGPALRRRSLASAAPRVDEGQEGN